MPSTGSLPPASRARLWILGLGVAVAVLSWVVSVETGVLTGTSRRAVEATAGVYGTTPTVAFLTLHAPLLFGVVMGVVGTRLGGVLLAVGASSNSADGGTSLGAALRVAVENGLLATVVALGIPLILLTDGLPATLAFTFVAGLPLGVLALGGATAGTALAAERGWQGPALLGTVAPVVGLLLAHAAPTGPVWTASLGATFTSLALLGGGWSLLHS